MQTQRSRNWCFTINNWTDEEVHHLKEAGELNKYIFICWGYETGNEGTKHLQGYLELKNAAKLGQLKKHKGLERAHFEVRLGTKLEAATYCSKEMFAKVLLKIKALELMKTDKSLDYKTAKTKVSDANEVSEDKVLKYMRNNVTKWRNSVAIHNQRRYYEAGDWEHGLTPGKRNDIHVVRELAKNGSSFTEILEHVNSYQAAKFAQLYMANMQIDYRCFKKKKIYWFYGPSGTGKSRMAHEMALYDIWKAPSNKIEWYDNYNGQKSVIFDEFRGRKMPFTTLLEILDGYKIMCAVKGGFTCFWPDEVFITCPWRPEKVYGMCDEEMHQLIRRITSIIRFNKDGTIVDETDTNTEVGGNTTKTCAPTLN